MLGLRIFFAVTTKKNQGCKFAPKKYIIHLNTLSAIAINEWVEQNNPGFNSILHQSDR